MIFLIYNFFKIELNDLLNDIFCKYIYVCMVCVFICILIGIGIFCMFYKFILLKYLFIYELFKYVFLYLIFVIKILCSCRKIYYF